MQAMERSVRISVVMRATGEPRLARLAVCSAACCVLLTPALQRRFPALQRQLSHLWGVLLPVLRTILALYRKLA